MMRIVAGMCAVALISFILAWRYPFFWLVFLWSLWVMAQQRAQTSRHARIDPQAPRREPPHPNTLYDLLEVSSNASPEVIKAAYRQLAMKYHPDRQPDAQSRRWAEEQMKAINAAYEILSDPVRRAEYDRRLREGLV